MAIAGSAAMFSWGDALYWYRNTLQDSGTRVTRTEAPFGKAAIQIDTSFARSGQPVGQFVSSDAIYGLRNKTLTLGAWMWADRPMKANLPVMAVATFDDETRTQFKALNEDQQVQLTARPKFYKIVVTVPATAVRGWIFLNPVSKDSTAQNAFVYYDGIVLTEGVFSDTPPHFSDETAANGTWDNKEFTNLLRNASAELSGPRVRPWVDKYTKSIPNINGRVSVILAALIDQKGSGWYFRSAFSNMFQTFWSKFAAGKVFLLSFYAYEILQYLTLLALAGVLIRLLNWKTFPWDIALPFGLSLIFIWASAFLRGVPELNNTTTVIPWARYALPSIIPVAVLLCAGWITLGKALKRFGFTEAHLAYGFLALMVSLNIYTILSINAYFSDQTRTSFDALFFITLFAMFCAVWLGSKTWRGNMK
jgi:hypothetical protein